MMNRKSVMAAVIAGAIAIGTAATGHGWTGQRNTIAFGAPVALPGVVLPAGEYRFEVVPTAASVGIVRVTRARDHQAYYMGFTNEVPRPRNLDRKHPIVLGEAKVGAPRPITAWFPVEGGQGREFIY
jgi:hypothetical protein